MNASDTSHHPLGPPAKLTFTEYRGEQAERQLIIRGMHDAILRGKASLDQKPNLDLCVMATRRSEDDWALVLLHTFDRSKPAQGSWVVYEFTGPLDNPLTRGLALMMLRQIEAAYTGIVEKLPETHKTNLFMSRTTPRDG